MFSGRSQVFGILLIWLSQSIVQAQEVVAPKSYEELQKENAALQQQVIDLQNQLQALQPSAKPSVVSTGESAPPDGKVPPTPTAPVAGTTEVTLAPPPLWKNELSVGGSLNTGNTNAYELQVKDVSDRQTAVDRLHLEVMGDFKRLQGETVTDRAETEAQYNRDFAGPWYGYVHDKGERDDILHLTYRVQAGPGVGYNLVKSDAMTLALEAGPAVQLEKYHLQGEDTTAQSQLADHFNWHVSKTFRLFEDWQISKEISLRSDFLSDLSAGMETKITNQISFRLTGDDRFNFSPEPGTKRNDLSLITSLVYDF